MLTLPELNEMDQPQFVAALREIFEGPPWIVERAWKQRPFHSIEHLHSQLCSIIKIATREEKIALLCAHPDLVGRAALQGTLSTASTSEQAAAGLNQLTIEEIAIFQRLNQLYREQFGFPFVICARENKKESILQGFTTRLLHSPELEIEVALDEVTKIALLRLHDTIAEILRAPKAKDELYATRLILMGGHKPPPLLKKHATISYGKLSIPIYRVNASPLQNISPIPESAFVGRSNTLFVLAVDLEVLGDAFLPAYTQGDNTPIIATDSMKNFVLHHALNFEGATIENYLTSLGQAFMARYPVVQGLRLRANELPFSATSVPQAEGFAASNVLFQRSHNDYSSVELLLERNGEQIELLEHHCSRNGLQLLKVTGSAFTRFVRDDYTTLPERGDRPLFIYVDLSWRYREAASLLDPASYVAAEQVRDLVQVVFHEFVSESIQHLVYEMGTRLLTRFPQLAEVTFSAQNRTPDPYGESERDPNVKVYSEPFAAYGIINLTLRQEM
jgi:urate oxidase/2-oxo-4-hydroxy-4-carboxy-5-ureidoimidazoline decarboxylase